MMNRTLQTAIGIASWVLLIGLWIQLALEGHVSLSGVEGAAIELGLLSGAVIGVTMLWVHHNIRIYRRKGPRTGRAENVPRSDEDRLGHPIRWDLPGGVHGARDTRLLTVRLDDGTKIYERGV